MGAVTKTRTQMVGDAVEQIQYYFESYEDFIKFESFLKANEVENELDEGKANEVENELDEGKANEVENELEEGGTSDTIDIVEGKEYKVVDNTSGHDFPLAG